MGRFWKKCLAVAVSLSILPTCLPAAFADDISLLGTGADESATSDSGYSAGVKNLGDLSDDSERSASNTERATGNTGRAASDLDLGQSVNEIGSFQPNEGEGEDTSKEATASTNVRLRGYDYVLPGVFQIDSKSDPVMLADESAATQSDAISVSVSNGSSVYDVKWERAVLDGNEEGELEDVTRASDSMTGATGSETFTHCLADDTFAPNTVYNYYVTITDTLSVPPVPVSTLQPYKDPIKVIVDSSSSKSLYDEGPVTTSPWMVQGGDGTLGVNGLIYAGDGTNDTELVVNQLDYLNAQSTAAYVTLRDAALEQGKVIAGSQTYKDPNTGESTTLTGTAVWHLIIDNADFESAALDAFLGNIMVVLDLDDTLDKIGMTQLPDNFESDYTLMRTGGGNGIEWSGLNVNVAERTIGFVISGTGEINIGDLGYYALVRTMDREQGDEVFTVTPQVYGGHGQIDPMVPHPYAVGSSPTFTFTPDGGFEVASVRVYETGGSDPIYSADYPEGSNANGYTLPNTWGKEQADQGKPIPDATVIVTFREVAHPDDLQESTVRVSVGENGTVDVSGTYASGKVLNASVSYASAGGKPVDFKGVAAGEGTSLELSFRPNPGYHVASVQVTSDLDAVPGSGDWTNLSWTGSSYRLPEVSQPAYYYRVEFTKDAADVYEYHTLSAFVETGADSGKATFAGDVTSKRVPHGESATFLVEPAEGFELSAAKVYYVGAEGREAYAYDIEGYGGSESGDAGASGAGAGGSDDAGGSSSSGSIEISNVNCDTNVYFSFVKSGSPGPGSGSGSGDSGEGPGSGSGSGSGEGPGGSGGSGEGEGVIGGGTGVIASPTTSLVNVSAFDQSGNAISGWASIPDVSAGGVELSVGYEQTYIVFYQQDGKTWVIDSYKLVYDGDESTARRITSNAGTNYVSLMTPNNKTMDVTFYLRPPRDLGGGDGSGGTGGGGTGGGNNESDKVITDPGELPGTGIETGEPVTPPGVSVDPSGNVTGEKTDPETGDTTEIVIPGKPGGKDDEYEQPTDGEGNTLTEPDGSPLVNPETGNPYVDASGHLCGAGGMMDERGNWQPGGTVSSVGKVPPNGTLVVNVTPWATGKTDEHASDYWYWTIDQAIVDGVTLVPYASDNGVFELGEDGKYYFLEDGARTDEYFTYANGLVTFHNMKQNHDVQASFERAVDTRVYFVSEQGHVTQVEGENGFWKLFKPGAEYRFVSAPVEGSVLKKVTVNDEVRFVAADEEHGVEGVNQLDALREGEWEKLSRDYAARHDAGPSGKSSLVDVMMRAFADAFTGVAYADGDGSGTGGAGAGDGAGEANRAGGTDNAGEAGTKNLDSKGGFGYSYVGTAPNSETAWTDNPYYEKKAFSGDKVIETLIEYASNGSGGEGPGGEGPGGGDEPDPGPGNKPSDGDDTNPEDPNVGENAQYQDVTAKVVGGGGWIEREGETTTTFRLKKGDHYNLTIIPQPGYHVLKVVDNGVVHEWPGTTYRIAYDSKAAGSQAGKQAESRLIEVYFTTSTGSGDGSDRVIRRITSSLSSGSWGSMAKTGDSALPMMLIALGVALGASGVAILVNGRYRRK